MHKTHQLSNLLGHIIQNNRNAWLRLHDLAAASLPAAAKGKFGPRYYGPYHIINKVKGVACKLELLPSTCIHDVFHISLLKLYEGVPPEGPPYLPPLSHGEVIPAPVAVLWAHLHRDSWHLADLSAVARHDSCWCHWRFSKKRFPQSSSRTSTSKRAGEMLCGPWPTGGAKGPPRRAHVWNFRG